MLVDDVSTPCVPAELGAKGLLFWKLFMALWLSMMLSLVGAIGYFHLSDARHRPMPPPGVPVDAHGNPLPPGLDGRPPGPPPGGLPPYLPLVPVVSGALASLMCSALLAWYLARPIRHLRWALSQVALEHFDTRVLPRMGGRRDEIVDLAKDFDRMAAQLQGLSNSRKELLHNVSHELRSPLARMRAAVGLARQDDLQMPLMLDRIDRETLKLDALIEEMLTLHRLEGDAAWSLSPVNVTEILKVVADDAAFEARMAGKALVLDIDRACELTGNDELIRRALDNVIRNAIKFSQAGGTVRVRARLDPGDGVWHCEVLDRGPGVPPDLLDAIFQPFMRVEGPQALRGSGLGLAIARRAVAVHGGRIGAVSREGGGLAMCIALPLVRPAAGDSLARVPLAGSLR